MHAGLVEWREWGDEAFAEAREKDTIILLDISAVWCHWCHVMDETSYSDPEVAGIINDRFVPVRVDTDRMPDVNERYNMGGWPTTAFLTPTGEVLVGATYVPPDKLKETIHSLLEFYDNNREELKQRVSELREKKRAELDEQLKAADGELPEEITEFVLGQIEENFDQEYGGFGTEPKFPVAEALDLLLASHKADGDGRYLDMAAKTMRGMASYGMYDHVMGGFFRYSVTRDWGVPHYEKMSESNAALIVSYTNAYKLTRQDFYIDTVRRTLDYINEWLWNPKGYFRGSQDADEEYYSLSLEMRLKRKSPYVDDTVYANFNAKMASAFMTAYEVMDRDCCVGRAMSALDFVLANMSKDGGLYHFLDTAPRRFGLLTDHTTMLRALLHAYQITSDPNRLDQALGILRFMDKTLLDARNGGYFDVPYDEHALGALTYRSKPFLDNADAAHSLMTLAVLTGERSYEEKAVACLRSHSHDFAEYGYMASGYALSAEFVKGPVTEIVLTGAKEDPALERLVRTAFPIYVPRRVVRVLRYGIDDAEIKKRGYPSDGQAAAYICKGTSCSARIEDPDALSEALKAV